LISAIIGITVGVILVVLLVVVIVGFLFLRWVNYNTGLHIHER